jgi:molybdopterin-guanine dinucleotide biosynthesis protein A
MTLAALLERRIADGRLALRDALAEASCVQIECDEQELLNVNTRAEFDAEKARRSD